MSEANFSLTSFYRFKLNEQSTAEGVERVLDWVNKYIPTDDPAYVALQNLAKSQIVFIESQTQKEPTHE